ncbi:MAG TPA: site-specific integrase [Thermoleophilaceae bacterium]|jgi:integrase
MGPKKLKLQNGEVRWEIRFNDAGRGSPYRRRRFERREDAQTFLDDIRRRRRLGELAEAEWARRTVRQLALDWWELYAVPNLSPRTLRDYRKLLDRHIVPRLGGHRLRDVSVGVVDDFKARLLAAGVGDSQTRQALAVLSAMFTYAERRDRITRNPVRLVKKPSSRRKRAVVCLPPRDVELARARLVAEGRYGDAALVCLLAYAGPRPQEALAIEWRHVRERTLLFEQKNLDGELVAGQKTARPPRTTPLWAPLRDDLIVWQLRCGSREGLVFPNYKGEPWTETDWGNWAVRVWHPLREELGVSEPPYGLRHAYASLRIREGASIPELAEELGHSPQMTLGTYAHVIDELRGAERRPAPEEISRARAQVAEYASLGGATSVPETGIESHR